jgi:hypothetical protein
VFGPLGELVGVEGDLVLQGFDRVAGFVEEYLIPGKEKAISVFSVWIGWMGLFFLVVVLAGKKDRLTVPYPARKPAMRPAVDSHLSSGTMALRASRTMSQNLSCSSLSSRTRREDWELKDEGTSLTSLETISSMRSSGIGEVLVRA